MGIDAVADLLLSALAEGCSCYQCSWWMMVQSGKCASGSCVLPNSHLLCQGGAPGLALIVLRLAMQGSFMQGMNRFLWIYEWNAISELVMGLLAALKKSLCHCAQPGCLPQATPYTAAWQLCTVSSAWPAIRFRLLSILHFRRTTW